MFLRPHQQKLQSYLFVTSVLIRSNKIRLNDRNAFDKAISVGGKNNAGVWRRSLQPSEAKGGSEVEPLLINCFTIVHFYLYFALRITLI